MTTVFNQLSDWMHCRSQLKTQSIGFVPTMGNLHAGHGSLLERSCLENDVTVLSIFVNPTQFDQMKDLKTYPKTLEQDLALAKKLKADYLLLPNYQQLYPDDYRYRISETLQSLEMEGAFRPGHFDGVLTVVMKLFNIVKPTRAYFGEKDFQQLTLIKGMVDAFFLDVMVVPCATVRETSGFALSSRNSQLSVAEKEKAKLFPQLLADNLLTDEMVMRELERHQFKVEYVKTKEQRRYGAVRLGEVRLIDNRRV